MYESAGSGVGAAAGAGLGSLGRSPLLEMLRPLDYPRQAAWNAVRGPSRLLSGEGGWQDLLGMLPGLAGLGGLALGGPLGGVLGAGLGQGLGQMSGNEAFEASTPQDVTGSDSLVTNLLLGAATDPLTYTGLGIGPKPLAGSPPLGMGGLVGGAEDVLGRGFQLNPQEVLRDFRMGRQLPGMERDAVMSGLAGRNQMLGQQVAEGGKALDIMPHGPPLPEELIGRPRWEAPTMREMGPNEIFDTMLPDYQRSGQIGRTLGNQRNYLPEPFMGMNPEDLASLRGVPTNQLNARLAPALPGMQAPDEMIDMAQMQAIADGTAGPMPELDGIRDAFAQLEATQQALPPAGFAPQELQQLQRYNALEHASNQSRQAMQQWQPLADHLANSGKLGGIERGIQEDWGILGDMLEQNYLRPAQVGPEAQRLLGRGQGFEDMFGLMPEVGGSVPPTQMYRGMQGAQDVLGASPQAMRSGSTQTTLAGLEDKLRVGALREVRAQDQPIQNAMVGQFQMGGRNTPEFQALAEQQRRLHAIELELARSGSTAPRNFWEGFPPPATGMSPESQAEIQALFAGLGGLRQELGIVPDLPRLPPLPEGVLRGGIENLLPANQPRPPLPPPTPFAPSRELQEAAGFIQRMPSNIHPASPGGRNVIENRIGRPLTPEEIEYLERSRF